MQGRNVLLFNARVMTMDDERPYATAVLISDDKIAAVGGDDMARFFRSSCRAIDLLGAAVLPGFIDAHCHLRGLGQSLRAIDCSADRAASIDELVALLKQKQPDGGWIFGRGYDQNRLEERRHPIASDLDCVSLDRPVFVMHSSGHGCSVNSAALRLAHVDSQAVDTPGGTIERDASGRPTGRLTGNAMNLVLSVMPIPTLQDRIEAIAEGSNYAASLGITSTAESSADIVDLAAFDECARLDRLKVRCSPWVKAEQLRDFGWPSPQELGGPKVDGLVTIDTAKVFVDGAIGTRTALLRVPYADDPHNCGTAIWSDGELDDLVCGAAGSGWRIAAHAIGDRAVDRLLSAYCKFERGSGPRHRVEHAMLLHDDQIRLMKSLGVHPVFQPEFLARFGDMYVDAVGRRASRIMPYRDVTRAGIVLSFSSDMPVVRGRPLDGIAAAVSRASSSGRVLGIDQQVTVVEALAAYTSGAAYAENAENVRGKIVEGMLADLTILSRGPVDVPLDEWDGIETVATIVGGTFTYDPSGIEPFEK